MDKANMVLYYILYTADILQQPFFILQSGFL